MKGHIENPEQWCTLGGSIPIVNIFWRCSGCTLKRVLQVLFGWAQVFLKEISAWNVTGLLWAASQILLLDHSETAIYPHFPQNGGHSLSFLVLSFLSSYPSRAPRSLILDAAFLKSNEAWQNSIPQLLLLSHPHGKGGTGTQKWSILSRVRTETSVQEHGLLFHFQADASVGYCNGIILSALKSCSPLSNSNYLPPSLSLKPSL